jgi:hypothetical protein
MRIVGVRIVVLRREEEGESAKEGIMNEGSADAFVLRVREGPSFTGVLDSSLCRAFVVEAILTLAGTGVASRSSSKSLSLSISDPASDVDCNEASSLDSYAASPQESPRLPRSRRDRALLMLSAHTRRVGQ